MKKNSFLLMLGILVMALSLAYSGYLAYSKASLETDVKKTESTLLQLQEKWSQFENNSVEQAISAKKTVEELSKTIIKWSRVIKDIRKTIPKDKNGQPLVEVMSYAGSGDNQISMSVKTMSSSTEPYFDVAKLIQSFDESDLFDGGFVPSISAGDDQSGSSILTFSFSTSYVGNGDEQEIEDLSSSVKR